MPLRNRVTPLGEIIATDARGTVYGNRGCLHDAQGEIRRRYQVKRWISCRLEFKGRRRAPLVQPGRYTELFFLDEATAFAAGHRPCAECRRDDYRRFLALVGETRADAVDEHLHAERLGERQHALLDDLPDATFVLHDGSPWLVLGDRLLSWTPAGYARSERRLRGVEATLLTPPMLVGVLSTGWAGAVPLVHPSAGMLGA